MSTPSSLLIELGCEELPPKALDTLATAFAGGIRNGLQEAGIEAAFEQARSFSTPRRLAVWIPQVAAEQPDQQVERRGPAVAAGLDEQGKPTRALTGFARSCGVDPDALERMTTDKGEWFVYRAVTPGKPLAALLQRILDDTIKALPIPKPMRWSDHDYRFVRPVHWLLALHGEQVVDLECLGLASDRVSSGHRFHHPQPLQVASADAWLETLRVAQVLADPAERRSAIEQQCSELLSDKQLKASPLDGDGLMQELVNITEWPRAILCRFEDDFLRLPGEVLRTTMELDQRFIPTAAEHDGQLSPWFIGVANIDSKDPAQIRQGYERVIRPRFADAQFFYQEDLKTPLADLQPGLEKITYQKALGSVWDKTTRVAELARIIANRVGVDAGQATRAAALCKCDLLTRMVGEFPDLQGNMGYHYAREQGEAPEVARALDAFYMPRHGKDAIAPDALSRVLAAAERIDTLAGIFAVGLKPGGNKDPFALRRAALGLGRTLIEGAMDLDIHALFIESLQMLPDQALQAGAQKQAGKNEPASPAARRKQLLGELLDFLFDRLRGYYASQGFTSQQFEAVLAVAPVTLPDFDRRIRAVAEFACMPEAENLAAANKRVGNILRKQGDDGAIVSAEVDEGLFDNQAEHDLASAVQQHGQTSRQCRQQGDYTGALRALAALQPQVDQYFEDVMVMADDPAVRGNRLALLKQLHQQFLAIADIGQL